jgi:hypothetical protein
MFGIMLDMSELQWLTIVSLSQKKNYSIIYKLYSSAIHCERILHELITNRK